MFFNWFLHIVRYFLCSLNFLYMGSWVIWVRHCLLKSIEWNDANFVVISRNLVTLLLIDNGILMYYYIFKWKEWFILTCQHWRVHYIIALQSEMWPYPSNLTYDPITGNIMKVSWQIIHIHTSYDFVKVQLATRTFWMNIGQV